MDDDSVQRWHLLYSPLRYVFGDRLIVMHGRKYPLRRFFTIILAAAMSASVAQGDLFCELGILSPATLEGNNPATGEPWQVGDQYRLVFVSNGTVDPQNSSADDIEYWNDAVQAFADNATGHDLSGVEWRIIGSTGDIDARDNTETNTNVVEGVGNAIFAMDGSSVIENNYVDLWDGEAPVGRPVWTQNAGEHMDVVGGLAEYPLTGTHWSGTAAAANLRLRDLSGGGNIRQGMNRDTGDGAGWIDAFNIGAAWSSSSALPVYGMSMPLEIVGPSASVIIVQ